MQTGDAHLYGAEQYAAGHNPFRIINKTPSLRQALHWEKVVSFICFPYTHRGRPSFCLNVFSFTTQGRGDFEWNHKGHLDCHYMQERIPYITTQCMFIPSKWLKPYAARNSWKASPSLCLQLITSQRKRKMLSCTNVITILSYWLWCISYSKKTYLLFPDS